MMRPLEILLLFRFEDADEMPDAVCWRVLQHDMYMVFSRLHSLNIPLMAFCCLKEYLFYFDAEAAG